LAAPLDHCSYGAIEACYGKDERRYGNSRQEQRRESEPREDWSFQSRGGHESRQSHVRPCFVHCATNRRRSGDEAKNRGAHSDTRSERQRGQADKEPPTAWSGPETQRTLEDIPDFHVVCASDAVPARGTALLATGTCTTWCVRGV
jgi:hypothetical protein